MEDTNFSEENGEPMAKKIKTEWVKSYSDKAFLMMTRMGYEKNKGLGKQNQGRLEPIIAVQQDGRKGLGLKADECQISLESWDNTSEVINLPEKFSWLTNDSLLDWSFDVLKSDIILGAPKRTIDDECLYCDPIILKNILEAKSEFDKLNDAELRRSRARSNPFETIRSSIFLNRAAVKMANIDSMCEYMFTNPKDKNGTTLLQNNELLYFADICAGPGGFSEYILYRKSWEAKGFGFTLRGPNDFKLDKFFAGSPESFHTYYGIRDDGNIFFKDNQDSFAEYVLKHCKSGVHFVMADGGFSVEGQENIQEILSKQLYLCQCLTALKILRVNGSFLCKMFDLFTPFSIGLIYLMYKCFDKISILKPNSSRPANSERYLVCKWKKPNTDSICKYLDHVNDILNESNDDVLEIVKRENIVSDQAFLDYIVNSNNEIGQNQIVGLKKIAAYCRNTQLKETKQSEIRKRCLELWGLPDKLRQAPESKTPEKLLEEILGDWNDKLLFNSLPNELNSTEHLHSNINSIYDWYFVPIGRGETNVNTYSMFLCKSKGSLFRYTSSRKWEPVGLMFEGSPKSLFYGEIVYEYTGEGRTQTRISALHIIDAIMLGGIDIRRLKLSERSRLCQKYALSLNKPYKEGNCYPIRSKCLYGLRDLNKFFNDMRSHVLKDNSTRLGLSVSFENKFFVPGGIMLFCEISHNFFSSISHSTQKLYYFDKRTRTSYYKIGMPNEIQNTLYASFRNSYQRRLLWKWTNLMQVEEQCEHRETNLLYREDITTFLCNKDKV
ncbi:cap-specific mRNA (nucleoside-2'-O-)-methyltransferase 1 isoform X1 [Ceratitis capitata]|uniref:Cap-specific mRNA (nucleoside-2'-O-)-methyltransferase 1 n=1 Tax=Ceratitis capitata TaxID=7213 RepID=W8C3C7_CERCA|nr:cap-specific mRNA (nucleoside-2'-O-)-methyltransferase 1 isoform X1 [Ceratitis capitata]